MVFGFVVLAVAATADVVAAASGAAQRNRGVLQAGIVGLGILGFGAWAQTTRASVNAAQIRSIPLYDDPLYVIVAFATGLPVLAILGGLGDTLAGKGEQRESSNGVVRANSAVALSMSGILLVGVGVLLGIAHAIEPLELTGTSILTGQSSVVIVGGLACSLGALQFWGPKLFGRRLAEPIAGLVALCLLGGGIAVGVADLIGGLDDMANPASLADFNQGDLLSGTATGSAGIVGILSLLGWALVAAGVSLSLLNLFVSVVAGRGPEAGDDPWGGMTLEWTTSSPPPPGNFAKAPVVTGPYRLRPQTETEGVSS